MSIATSTSLHANTSSTHTWLGGTWNPLPRNTMILYKNAGQKWQHSKYLKESSIIHFNGPKPWDIVKNDPANIKARKNMKDSALTKKWFQTAKQCGTTCIFEPYLTEKHVTRFS